MLDELHGRILHTLGRLQSRHGVACCYLRPPGALLLDVGLVDAICRWVRSTVELARAKEDSFIIESCRDGIWLRLTISAERELARASFALARYRAAG